MEESLTDDNRVFRHHAAYLMAMLWEREAAPRTLDVLRECLEDPSIPADAQAAIGGRK